MSVPYGKMGEGDEMESQPQSAAPPPTVPAVVIPAAPVQIQQVTTVPGVTQPAQPPESKLAVKYAKVLSALQVSLDFHLMAKMDRSLVGLKFGNYI